MMRARLSIVIALGFGTLPVGNAWVASDGNNPATSLIYMQLRYHDAGMGRFLSVDPVTANASTGSNFSRYWYANNSPYTFTDPDGRVAVVTRQKDGSVLIQFPTRFTGPAATSENIAAVKQHVAAMSGRYSVNGTDTNVRVEVTEVDAGIFGGTPRAARNEMKLVEGETSHETGRSFAEVGGRRGEIDVTDRFVANGIAAHEFSHLGGLDDLYDRETGLSDPVKGNGIMNMVPGVIDPSTIEGIINDRSNIQRAEK